MLNMPSDRKALVSSTCVVQCSAARRRYCSPRKGCERASAAERRSRGSGCSRRAASENAVSGKPATSRPASNRSACTPRNVLLPTQHTYFGEQLTTSSARRQHYLSLGPPIRKNTLRYMYSFKDLNVHPTTDLLIYTNICTNCSSLAEIKDKQTNP